MRRYDIRVTRCLEGDREPRRPEMVATGLGPKAARAAFEEEHEAAQAGGVLWVVTQLLVDGRQVDCLTWSAPAVDLEAEEPDQILAVGLRQAGGE